MKLALVLLWVLLSILGAVAFAHVTGLVYPHEKVNGLWLVTGVTIIGGKCNSIHSERGVAGLV